MDGTLIQAWASHKSFKPRTATTNPDPGAGDAQATGAGGDTHASTTDPDARQYRKSQNTGAILAYQGHVLMENRSGLVVGATVTRADGFGERAAVAMLDAIATSRPRTVGADKAYDTRDFTKRPQPAVMPHVAATTPGLAQRDRRPHDASRGLPAQPDQRKRIEEHFSGLGQDGRAHPADPTEASRRPIDFGRWSASNLVRMARMLSAVPQGGAG